MNGQIVFVFSKYFTEILPHLEKNENSNVKSLKVTLTFMNFKRL